MPMNNGVWNRNGGVVNFQVGADKRVTRFIWKNETVGYPVPQNFFKSLGDLVLTAEDVRECAREWLAEYNCIGGNVPLRWFGDHLRGLMKKRIAERKAEMARAGQLDQCENCERWYPFAEVSAHNRRCGDGLAIGGAADWAMSLSDKEYQNARGAVKNVS